MSAQHSEEHAHPAEDSAMEASVMSNVNAARDVSMTTSVAGLVNAQGDAEISQGGALAVVSQGHAAISQGGAGAIVSNSFSGDSFGSGVVLGNEVSVANSWVGFALTPKMEVSEDSHVIIGTKGALIIAAAIFGVFGLAAVLAFYAGRRVLRWRPKVPVPSVSWRRAGEWRHTEE